MTRFVLTSVQECRCTFLWTKSCQWMTNRSACVCVCVHRWAHVPLHMSKLKSANVVPEQSICSSLVGESAGGVGRFFPFSPPCSFAEDVLCGFRMWTEREEHVGEKWGVSALPWAKCISVVYEMKHWRCITSAIMAAASTPASQTPVCFKQRCTPFYHVWISMSSWVFVC